MARKRNRQQMDRGSSDNDNDDDLLSSDEVSVCDEYTDLGFRDRKKIGSHRAAMNHFGKYLSKAYPLENWSSAEDISPDKWNQSIIGKL